MADKPTTPQDEQNANSEEEQTVEEPVTDTAVATAEEPEEEEKKEDKLEQTVDVEDVGPCKKHVKVEIGRASIDSRLNEKFSELAKDAVVPGFRPGKAPRKVLERHYLKDVGYQIKGELLMASMEQLADDYDIAPISAPNVDPRKIELPKSGPMVYEFDVEVRPQFDLPDYKNLKLKRPVRDFAEQDVDREQRRLLSEFGRLVPKEGAAELDDYITVDMYTKKGNDVIGKVQEITLRVDNRVAFKDGVAEDFGDNVVGRKAGDEVTVSIKMSDNVANPNLAGQTVTGELEIKDVKELELPELTHEFLHTFGVHSVDELREEIVASLKRRLEYHQRQSARQQILQQFESASKLELPHDLLLRQAKRSLQRRAMEMEDAGMSQEEIQGRLRVMQQDIVRSSAMSLKEHFVLQKIAEDEKIEVEDAEINEEIEALAEEADESPRRAPARLEKEGQMDTLAALIIERKALDLILENAEYTDVAMDASEDESMAVSEEQAVEGEMRDVSEEAEKEAEEEGKEETEKQE